MGIRQWWSKVLASSERSEVRPDGPPEPRGDIGPALWVGGMVLVLGFAAIILWSVLAPLDEGVPAMGSVVVDTKSKTIQHLTGGLVEKVLVREGQWVNTGDLLIKLNDGAARAEYEAARQRYLGLRAMEDRLVADKRGDSKINFHPDVLAGKADPLIGQHIQAQEQLIQSRRRALQSELSALGEAKQAQHEAEQGFRAQLESRLRQRRLIGEELEGLRALVAESYAPRNKLLELERSESDLESTISDLKANLAKAGRSAAELSLRKTQKQQEYFKEIDEQLAEVRREVSADEERYKSTRDALGRTEIRSPVSGAVVGIATQTIGGVIAPGARVMDIVPKDEVLMLEAQLPPNLVDRVHPGQKSDIRFSNFSLTPQLAIEGELVSVSADLLTDPVSHASYYLARVLVTKDGMKTLGSHRLQPGMPAEIVIKTGERSLFAYLLHPLTRRLAWALKEE